MKYLFQAALIMLVTLAGEALRLLIPLPIPASIYGLVIMLVCLKTRLIRLQHVADTGHFLLEIMPVLFIPAAVGLIAAWADVQAVLIPVLVITVVTTFIVMAAAGWAAQLGMGKRDRS